MKNATNTTTNTTTNVPEGDKIMETSIFEKIAATKDNQVLSENGNVGFKTTFNPLVDLNFNLPTFRDTKDKVIKCRKYVYDENNNLVRDENGRAKTCIEEEVIKNENINKLIQGLDNVFSNESRMYLLKYIFYVRDIREGLGERNFFREAMRYLLTKEFVNKDKIMLDVIGLIPEFGRYDDVFVFIDTKYEQAVLNIIGTQLKQDIRCMEQNLPVSLLAKWMPSENTSSKETVALAKHLRSSLKMNAKEYRKMLSKLRAYLNVTETYTSANRWSEIDYNKVPSNANIKYNTAFLKHDTERRQQYLADLASGKAGVKINAAVNYPYQIVHSYGGKKASYGNEKDEYGWRKRTYLPAKDYDEALEQLWKNQKQMPTLDNTIVVRDGSGSMEGLIFGSTVFASEVADSLTIYCAERLSGSLKNKFITFSSEAKLVTLPGTSLYDNLAECYKYTDCSNTDILNVFRLLLSTAKNFKLTEEELPKQLLIISDMEFDGCYFNAEGSVFDQAKKEYAEAGYKLPRLVFWNVNSRTGSIPVLENENGILLISGFSVVLLEMVLDNKDTYTALVDKLLTERYRIVPYLD